jgi:transposase-like protein
MTFKLQVVAEVEEGRLTHAQAQRKYGIQSKSTIFVWLQKHGTFDWKELPTVSKEKTPEQRIKELEALLIREREKVHVLNTAIDIADEMFKTNIRKKYLSEQLKKRKSQS